MSLQEKKALTCLLSGNGVTFIQLLAQKPEVVQMVTEQEQEPLMRASRK